MPHTRIRNLRTALVSALIGLALSVGIPSPVLADTTDAPADVRWSVTPANADGPDGRTAVEMTADPGERIEDFLAVRNAGDETVEFRLTAADGFYTRAGRFDMLPADRESVDAGTWISLPETVTVAPRQTAVVPFSIAVPERAEPGDHAAGITASVLSVQQAADGTAVGVDSRVGFRVTTRVTGELAPEAGLLALTGTYLTSWNPLRPGAVTVTFDVSNQGNTILLAEGDVSAGGHSIAFPAEGENPQQLLPGDTRTITVTVRDVLPLFVVPAIARVSPTVLTLNGDRISLEAVTAEVVVWAVPWSQLIILAGLVLVVVSIAWGRGRSRRRLAAVVAEAKEQGRREATAGDKPGAILAGVSRKAHRGPQSVDLNN